jgi:Xaa-Pro aminopeptidase
MDTHLTPTANKSEIVARLGATRAAMARANITALLVPSSDPHLSEYLPERWKAREWLSGFTGSMGTLIVTIKEAWLFADSRYWLQAETELADTTIQLFRIKSGASIEHIDWLANHVGKGEVVAVDGAVIGLASTRLLASRLSERGITLTTKIDVFNEVWDARATLPAAAIYQHIAPHAVSSRADKLMATRDAMKLANAQFHVLSALDDIAYLFNLRGSDVSFNPVFVSHAIVTMTDATLFVMPNKLSVDLIRTLSEDGINVKHYDEFHADLHAIKSASLLLDPRRITHRTHQAIAPSINIIEAVNPTTFAKSKKTDAEAAYIRQTMEQDGAAMAEFYAWFEAAQGHEKITEVTIDEKLTEARAKREGFISRSFATIAGFNANGALNHYRAAPATAATIEGNGILLIDSGGQYLGGTTDITRVWPIGVSTHEQRRDYTLVLKGMMALSNTQFPLGTLSPYLDAIARAPIWAAGFNYGHGTGHGVGYFMNVHEGPQSISQAMPELHTAMQAGMVTSIEPGLYRDGQWGMRIENLVLNVSAGNHGFGDFLQFETLTLCPIDTHLIDFSLLREDEIQWLNAYHAEVARRLLPHVTGTARDWLIARTKAV